jgi:restriction system protein
MAATAPMTAARVPAAVTQNKRPSHLATCPFRLDGIPGPPRRRRAGVSHLFPRRGRSGTTRARRGTPSVAFVLSSHPTKIDVQFLHQFPEFEGFLSKTKSPGKATEQPNDAPLGAPSSTPEEQLEAASGALNETLRDALLARILEASPASFERLIIDLLLKMGYGGSRTDAGEQLGRTGDGGVDGVIREDRLGLDRVYLQAKRYKPGNSVGSETVQAFIGALVGRGAQKGVLITTSTFTKNALETANQSGALRRHPDQSHDPV